MQPDTTNEKLARRVGDLLTNDPQFAAALPISEIAQSILQPGIGLAAVMRAAAEGYADRPALGERARAKSTSAAGDRHLPQLADRFDTVTYGQLWQRVTALAAVLAHDGLQAGDRVATLGFCSIHYTIVDMAIPLLGAVSVPLHAGAPVSQLQPMVAETEPRVIACSAQYVENGAQLAIGLPAPVSLIVFDYQPDLDDHREAVDAAQSKIAEAGGGVTLETLTALLQRAAALPAPPLPAADNDRLAAIIYTSGSSGVPKGAMQPEGLVSAAWSQGAAVLVQRKFALPAITLNYLPMSHTAGRSMLYSTLGAGGTAYFAATSDLSTLLEDLSMVRPTQLNFVPRIWEMLYREFLDELARRNEPAADTAAVEEEILADLRARVLGGRYITALTGSAPISADLAAWVERLLDSHLMNALGATESGSVIIDGKVQCPPVTDYKLVDVPELGYFSTDRPYPRGELLIKSRSLFRGYYKRPALTAEVFDEDGFYRTGDIVAETGPDEFCYVDRRNNVLKLSQGEFVTVSKLEATYANCALVHQIYVYGNSERSYLLAVVVPTSDALSEHGAHALKELILRQLQHAGRAAQLQTYEIPRDIIVETSPFTMENGLLSGIRKPSRPNLKRHYGERLERLYAQLAGAQQNRMRELRELSVHQPIVETVCAVAGALLGPATATPPADAHFTELGGDSLSALTFANTLHDVLAVEVPVDVIISPANDLRSVADFITARRGPAGAGPTFSSVHGTAATVVRACDLTLDKFIDTATLDGAGALARPTSQIRTVLLTGATGYLGRYLLLQWLQRVSLVGGTIICLVRAKDDRAARARLGAVFDTGDTDLLIRYQTLAADHLDVLCGDKAAADLGLDRASWLRLAERVDLIVDPAALVNHMLPYHQLFGSNVVGSAELIRLALTFRQKPLAYVSTIGVGATVTPAEFTEDADVRQISATRTLGEDYASGYATSKWAGEVLLREAHDLCGLPVSVFRCDMIVAEPGYRGQLNLGDMVSRLILSVAVTGLAPETFYRRPPDGQRARAHFDGLPVDFVAESISTLSARATKGFQTFHVMNPHDDGIGLDEYVDWMAQAGCHIERLADYDDWFSRFETALRNLPERQRQASLLPILQIYRHQQPAGRGTLASAPRFRAAVMEADVGGGGDIPHIGKPVIEKYLSDLELLGLLDGKGRAIAKVKES
jgi:fatty acid CoA ligase FadD9